MMQLLGAGVVVAGAAALGFHYAAVQGERVQDLLALKRALLILSSEIEYLRTPLPAASLNIGTRAERWAGSLFTRFGEILTDGEGETAYRAWLAALDGAKPDTALTPEDFTVIENFGKTLGYLDKQMQENAIAYTVAYIDETSAALQAQADKNRKMYRSLGVIGGLMLAVILW